MGSKVHWLNCHTLPLRRHFNSLPIFEDAIDAIDFHRIEAIKTTRNCQTSETASSRVMFSMHLWQKRTPQRRLDLTSREAFQLETWCEAQQPISCSPLSDILGTVPSFNPQKSPSNNGRVSFRRSSTQFAADATDPGHSRPYPSEKVPTLSTELHPLKGLPRAGNLCLPGKSRH